MALTLATGNTFVAGDVVTATKFNATVNSATYTGTLEVAKGGTGSATAADARTALGVPATADVLAVANDLSDLNDAATARANLGLGVQDIARCTTQTDVADATYVDVTGMTVDVVSGTTYTIESTIFYNLIADATAGVNLKLAGTATASSVSGIREVYSSGGVTPTNTGTSLPITITGLGTRSGGGATDGGMLKTAITIVCNGSGTVKWQIAQNAGVTTASAMLGSYMKVISY